MASLNKVMLIGNLGGDPEMKYTSSGTPVVNFSMATSRRWNTQEGDRREETEWHRIVAFGKLAETCGQYLKKGAPVYIEGRLQTRSWEDQNGTKRYMTEIVANEMHMLGTRQQNENVSDAPQSIGSGAPGPPLSAPASEADDDLPF